MINARAETLTQRSAFRDLFRRHRCLLPASGFYEWQTVKGGKQPTWVGMRDGQPFGLAGLYERWLSRDGEVLDTCTIVTTKANALVRDLHDRMPLIIAPADYERWLDAANADVGDLVAPFPSDEMTWYPVSSRVNAVRNDDASLIAEVEASVVGADEAPASSDEEELEEKVPVQASLL